MKKQFSLTACYIKINVKAVCLNIEIDVRDSERSDKAQKKEMNNYKRYWMTILKLHENLRKHYMYKKKQKR